MGDSKVILHGISQLNGNGFDDWQFRVQMYMDSLGLMEVLTGDPRSNDAAKAIFLQNDKKAKERLVSMLHSDCFCYVRDKRTAKEMWSSLETVFAKKSLISQLLLRKELAKLRMNDGDAMATFLLKFEKLVRKLKLTGANLDGAKRRQGISILSKNGFIKNMNSNSTSDLSCEVCLNVLERVHSGVCGPLEPTAWDGSKYYVSFIDDFSHFAAIYPIKKKCDVFDSFTVRGRVHSKIWYTNFNVDNRSRN